MARLNAILLACPPPDLHQTLPIPLETKRPDALAPWGALLVTSGPEESTQDRPPASLLVPSDNTLQWALLACLTHEGDEAGRGDMADGSPWSEDEASI